MALSREIILTLQQLEGIGNKTIFKIAEQASSSITSIEELCTFWSKLKEAARKTASVDQGTGRSLEEA